MRNSHIAILGFPHQPHVHPILPIVSTLIRRGYRVTYVTSDLFASRVIELGAEVVLCPLYIDPNDNNRFLNLFTLATRTLSEVTPFYENNIPNLILYDRAFFAGRVLSTRWSIPAITTSPVLAFEMADVSKLDESSTKWRDKLLSYDRDANRFFERYGIREDNSFFHNERLNIYLYPRFYQLDCSAFDERFFYAGRCAAEQAYHGVWRTVNAGRRPLVLVSTSTAYAPVPDYFKMCIDALSGLHWHVLLALGDNIDPASFHPLPPHCEIVQHIPLIKVMPHVNLFVCLGGPISTTEALYHGIPLVMITHGHMDPEAYAENAVRLGIGIHLRKAETTVENIRQSALRVMEDQVIVDRVRQLQQLVRREPGAEDTANRIEEYLQQVSN